MWGNRSKIPQQVNVQLVQKQWSKGEPTTPPPWLWGYEECNKELVLRDIRKSVEIKGYLFLIFLRIMK